MVSNNGHSKRTSCIVGTILLVATISLLGLAVLTPTAAAQDDECLKSNEDTCERVGPFSYGEEQSIERTILDAYGKVSPIVRGAELVVEESLDDSSADDGCEHASNVDTVEYDSIGSYSSDPVVCDA